MVALDHNVAATEPTNTSQRYYLTALLSSAASPAVPPSPRRPRVITGCGVAALGGRREEGAESGAPDGGVFAAACALGRGSSQTSPFRQLRTPTIRVGRLLRAPVRAMERLLDQTCRDFATAEPKRNGQHIISCGLVRLPSAWTSTPKALSRCERGGFSSCCVSATRSSAPARERVRSQSAEG